MKKISPKLFWLGVGLLILALATSTGRAAGIRSAPVPKNIKFVTVVGGLQGPLFATHAGDGSNRIFIVQRGGKILIYKNGALTAAPFLDVSALITLDGPEQGLLGLAFDPNYGTNGTFYIAYTAVSYAVTLARYQVSADPDLAETSGTVLLSVPKTRTNHNGGMITFGPDGYLYMSVGDGGGTGDPDNNAQNRTILLGKILRLDVSGAGAYSIPPTNPFYGNPNPAIKKEIWAYGLRNPWRFSFDRITGNLIIGDVGQDAQEEIDIQSAGAGGGQNYGWRILEGNLCYLSATCTPPAGYVPPVMVYNHGTNDSIGCSVTGGYVYRGSNFPDLVGVYLYADYCQGKIWGLTRNASHQWVSTLIADTGYAISSFGEDEQGELYLLDYRGSLIHIAEAPILSKTFPSRAVEDGYILETMETSGRGGLTSSTQSTFLIGDDNMDRQYRAVLSFATGGLPDNAKVLSATLRIRQQASVGTNPFTTHGRLVGELGVPYFGAGPALASADFEAVSDGTAASFNTTPTNSWYFARFNSPSLARINLTGLTQIRLRFSLDDNDDMSSDFIRFISGDHPYPSLRPVLIITYFIP